MQLFQGEITKTIQSPLNYTGGKYKLLPQILPLFPENINLFVDLFCGGCNVGINVECNKVLYNDIDMNLICMYNTFKNIDKQELFDWIYRIIEEFGLSCTSKHSYSYYNCESDNGLAVYNRNGYLKLREEFNRRTLKQSFDYYYYVMLYVIVVYAFNNQIRFNANKEFNLPVGKRDFNRKMQEKLSDFVDRLKCQNNEFSCSDFNAINIGSLGPDDFVYIDPPYLITCATYNEQGGWDERHEKDLLAFLDCLNGRNVRFALSNVLRSKGKENRIIMKWLKANESKYRVSELNYSYSNSNYQTKDKTSVSEEVLITNY